MILMNFDDLMFVFLILLLMLTRLQCDDTTCGDDFDGLMFVFLILLLMLARLQCDNKTYGDDFDDLMCVFLILLLMLNRLQFENTPHRENLACHFIPKIYILYGNTVVRGLAH